MENSSRKPDGLALKKYLESLPYSQYIDTRKTMISGCLIPSHTFSNWLAGKCRIPDLYKKTLEEIVGEKIFDESKEVIS